VAVPWLRRLVAGLAPRMIVFDLRPVDVRLCRTKWQWARFLSEHLCFPPSLSFHQCSIFIFIYILLLLEGQSLVTFQKRNALSEIEMHYIEKCFHILLRLERALELQNCNTKVYVPGYADSHKRLQYWHSDNDAGSSQNEG